MNWKTPENQFTVGYITAVSVGFVIVVFAVKGDLHPLWDWMHRWQTLLTGFIAFAAALLAWHSVQAQIKESKRQVLETKISETEAKKGDYVEIAGQCRRRILGIRQFINFVGSLSTTSEQEETNYDSSKFYESFRRSTFTPFIAKGIRVETLSISTQYLLETANDRMKNRVELLEEVSATYFDQRGRKNLAFMAFNSAKPKFALWRECRNQIKACEEELRILQNHLEILD